MQKLIDQRDALLREMDALKNKVAGLEMAIALLDSGPSPAGSGKSTRSVKTILLDLLQEVGTTGLNAATAVEIANRRGITLNLNSVGSTLSRFKRDGIVFLDGDRYRLKQFAGHTDDKVRALWPNLTA